MASQSNEGTAAEGRRLSYSGTRRVETTMGGLLFGALAFAAHALAGGGPGTDPLTTSLILGALFGFVLQRSRFCFFCAIRDYIDERKADGVLGILAALAAGVAGYTVVFGSWLPDPSTGRLAPDAFIGPVSWVLAAGGLAFGAGMAVSGSCISAHLYRLGEGSPTAPFALIGTVLGFTAGYATWNDLYTLAVADAPVIWLPNHLGYAGSLAAALLALGALAFWLLHRSAPPPMAAGKRPQPFRAIFLERWPGWIGGIAVAAIGTASYLRVAPLGVTADLGGRGRQLGEYLGLVPGHLNGLDRLRGCAAIAQEALLSPNGLFVAGMIVSALAASLIAGQFRPTLPTISQIVRGLTGGFLLGWGAMVALGCSIGTLLSGIMAGAASGWIFAVAMLAGLIVTHRIRQALG
ncbi:YeeE/YedE family protein [Pseudochelatococcus sp. B33]